MIGIVILNYKSYSDTFNCIESIKNTINNLPYHIYVVDNMSPNDSYKLLCEKYSLDSKVSIILSDKNGGFSYGNNIGFKIAIQDNCDKILCTNSDVLFYPDSIKILSNVLDNDENIAVVGPKVYCADGSIQNCNKGILTAKCFVLRRKPFSIFDWFGVEKKYSYSDYKYDKPLQLSGMVSGCCFMFRAKMLEEVDFLDDNVFLYHEEDILGAKLRKKGYAVILEPSAEIIHYGGGSTHANSAFIRYHTFYSGLYYLWNYANTSKFSFWFVSFIVKMMFMFKALFNRSYKAYYKKIKLDIKKIKNEERRILKI